MAQNGASSDETAGLTWVSTLGGPHIVIPESACQYWQGSPRDYPDNEGDYGRACEVDGYIDLIEVSPVEALVFGDHPGLATFLPRQRVLVRWIAADSTAALVEAASNAVESGKVAWDDELTWDVSEPLILFDSVYGHEYLQGEVHLRINLPMGRHVVRAGYHEAPDAYMILAQFTPAEAQIE
ncbi:Imm21 family immunity protein [Nonomuraea sp. NPDC005983]|uniref:Imm21 family immunity protein n=1 Tax=Nonomuraea sp. NPDC005983 TaxID=3155595 RepID=UPI0033A64B53